jgi:hypothetical protein
LVQTDRKVPPPASSSLVSIQETLQYSVVVLLNFVMSSQNGDYDPLQDLAKFGCELNMKVKKKGQTPFYIFGYTYLDQCIGKDDFFFNFGGIMAIKISRST